MNKIVFSSLMVVSAAVLADSTPTFDGSKLVLPYVNTSSGAYTATLQYAPPSSFNILSVGPSTTANTESAPPTFADNGLLTIPKVKAGADAYKVSMQLAQSVFTLTSVEPYQSTPVPRPSGPCVSFPANNVWNTPVNNLPLHPFSAAWISAISTRGVHPDFGSSSTIGQPVNYISGSSTPKYNFSFQYPAESDAVPYPIPGDVRLSSGDNLMLTVDTETCTLYEVYNAQKANNQWTGRRGAVWNLSSNALRPLGAGSADEAGLPYSVGLVRYDEVLSGSINHAIRFTFPTPSSAIWPARHTFGPFVAINNTPPLGARLRLNAGYDISAFPTHVQVILQAMKIYGIILADTGSALYISGVTDPGWDDDVLHALEKVKGVNFEAVNSECLMVNPNSGEANPAGC